MPAARSFILRGFAASAAFLSFCLGPGVARGAEPADGAIICAIEVGAKGIKGRVYVMSEKPRKNLPAMEPKFSKDYNSNLDSSKTDGSFSKAGIELATADVDRLLVEMLASHPECKPFLVGSSGVAAAKNRDELAQSVLDKTGQTLDFIDAHHEAKYAFKGSVPPSMRATSVIVDIGSGNTKIGALQGSEFKSIEVPFGTGSLTKEAIKEGGADFSSAVAVIIDKKIRPAFRLDTNKSPVVLNKKNTFLIGGVAWATATFIHPEKVRRRFVKLDTDSIANFRNSLVKRSWSDVTPSLISTAASRRVFEKESTKVLETFSTDNLIAGHGILAMFLESRASDGVIYFARSGNWIFGYVEEKFKADFWGSDTADDHT